MARQIDLADGSTVTRAWDGESFRFEVHEGGYMTVLRPTPQEMLDIGALFRRAGLKMRTRAKERRREEYEKPTLTPLGKHVPDCTILDGGICNCHLGGFSK
jgi:hypothetical protein